MKVQVKDLKSEKETVEIARDEAKDRLRRVQDRLAIREGEMEELKKKGAVAGVEIIALKEEVGSVYALDRLNISCTRRA